jgi:hypothetical protein
MQYTPRRSNSSLHHIQVVGIFCFLILCPAIFCEESTDHKRVVGALVCRTQLSVKRREELAAKLRKISGWPDLRFDSNGVLRHSNKTPIGGSQGARELLTQVMIGRNAVVLEDVSRNAEIAFMRVIPGRWKTVEGPPAFVVQIDFADFEKVMGDQEALAAFNLGWALLHELDHIANDSEDASAFSQVGECEGRINQMRAECDLPQRSHYFYELSPLTVDSTFATRLMRLGFEKTQNGSEKKRQFWIIWDANLVGGLTSRKTLASL